MRARSNLAPRRAAKRACLDGSVIAAALAIIGILTDQAAAKTAISEPVFGPRNARGIPVTMDSYPLNMTGTAFFVSKDGYLVTPFHVAGPCARRAILRPEGAYDAIAVAMYARLDIAVLKSNAPHTVAALSQGSVEPRAPLVIVRYAHLGGVGSRSAVTAQYTGAAQLAPINFVARAADIVVGGNSGSPAVRYDGGVAAMVTAVKRGDPHVVLAIGSDVLAQALQASGVPFKWQQERLPVSAAAGAAAATNAAIGFTFPIACYKSGK